MDLSIATNGLLTSQIGIETTGNNIANANTSGYNRQVVLQVEGAPTLVTVAGSPPIEGVGNGAEVSAIQRQHDQLLDVNFRQQSALQAGLQLRSDTLTQAEQAAGATGSASLDNALGSFFAAFQTLAGNPENAATRAQAVAQAQGLTTTFNQQDQQLAALQTQLDQGLQPQIAQVNQFAQQIAGLNQHILQAGPGGSNALLDQRDSLLDQVASLTGARVTMMSDGTADVAIGTTTLVDGTSAHSLVGTAGGNGFTQVTPAGSSAPVALGGQMGAAVTLRDQDLAGLRSQLNGLAATLAQQVNTLQQGGFTLGGAAGPPLFTGTTAGTLAVNAAVSNDPSQLAAAATAAGVPGDGNNALAIAQVGQALVMNGGTATLQDAYQADTAQLAVATQAATQGVQNQNAVVQMLTQQRQSTSGVNLDQEAASLLQYQRSYEASARLLTTMDQMLQTLIDNTS